MMNWKDLGDMLRLMGDGKNALRSFVKAWDLSHKKEPALRAIWDAISFGIPLEQLPQDLRTKLSHDFDFWPYAVNRDWQKVKQIGLSQKNYFQICMGYVMSGKRDSARYWARKGLEINRDDYYLNAFAGDRAKAFSTLDRVFEKNVNSGDDKMLSSYKMSDAINIHILLNEYREATTKLKELNETFPDFGGYEAFVNLPWMDKINKEYPPFQEAYNNLKRKPMLDVNDYIKL